MSEPEHFEILKEYAVVRPTGQVSIDQLVVSVIERPGYASQYFFVHDWARAAAGSVRVAIVVRPERFDHQKFGTTVAANVGFIADSFTSVEDALTWLERI